MLRVANSTPIVDFDSKLNSFLVNRERRLLFPTPESPINTTKIFSSIFLETNKTAGCSFPNVHLCRDSHTPLEQSLPLPSLSNIFNELIFFHENKDLSEFPKSETNNQTKKTHNFFYLFRSEPSLCSTSIDRQRHSKWFF